MNLFNPLPSQADSQAASASSRSCRQARLLAGSAPPLIFACISAASKSIGLRDGSIRWERSVLHSVAKLADGCCSLHDVVFGCLFLFRLFLVRCYYEVIIMARMLVSDAKSSKNFKNDKNLVKLFLSLFFGKKTQQNK